MSLITGAVMQSITAYEKPTVFTVALTYFRTALKDRDSAVGIATRYGLDGPGIESRWGRHFPHSSCPALGATQPPTDWVSFPGVTRPWCGVNHPTPSSAEVKERVELYLY